MFEEKSDPKLETAKFRSHWSFMFALDIFDYWQLHAIIIYSL